MTRIGSVAELWRFPMKSMQGERVSEAVVTTHGVLGDRAYALLDVQSGKVASAKNVKLFPDLLQCRATYLAEPSVGCEMPPVKIELPNGISVTSDSQLFDGVLSAYFKRELRLVRSAPEDFTIDLYNPDVDGANPGVKPDTMVEQKLGAALFDELGIPSPVPAGALLDAFPLSLVTTSTLARLNELRPQSRFESRRFRMNVTIATRPQGFVENDWVQRTLLLGDTLRVQVAMVDGRCVMTTLAQDDLPQDVDVLRTLVRHNRIEVGDIGCVPCAGVYAAVETAGVLRTGDSVAFAN